jgi:bifunctional DNA-binding transcriptional regulator/antitoxin component of YhaV-PrlF toxin-antitoxin module
VNKGTELIAHATVYQDGTTVRGKIPAPVVKALRAKGGDVLAFERQTDGVVIVRKSTAAERKSPIKSRLSKKGARK